MIPHPISRTRNSAPQSVFWPEHGPCFGSPCSAFWNSPSEINALRQNAEHGLSQNANPFRVLESAIEFRWLRQNAEHGFPSLKGRCLPACSGARHLPPNQPPDGRGQTTKITMNRTHRRPR